MGNILRQATANDLPGILEIYNDAIVTTTASYDYRPHTMEMRIKWFDDKIKAGIPVLVAVDGDTITGFASYGPFRAWAGYRYTVEHSIYVHRNYRGQGISKQLMHELISVIKTKKIHTVIASIDSLNEISYNLHLQLGFEEVALFRQVGYKFGKWLDLRFMQLITGNSFQPSENDNP